MSFYDEFLKSLEEDNENLESATEGLETEEAPAEEPEVSAEETPVEDADPEETTEDVVVDEEPEARTEEEAPAENSDGVDAMESLRDLFLLEAGIITDQYKEGEIGEESFVEEMDALCKEYGAADSVYVELATEAAVHVHKADATFKFYEDLGDIPPEFEKQWKPYRKYFNSKTSVRDLYDADKETFDAAKDVLRDIADAKSGKATECKSKVCGLESFAELTANIPELSYALENLLSDLPAAGTQYATEEPVVESEVEEKVEETGAAGTAEETPAEETAAVEENDEEAAEDMGAEESVIREVSDEEMLTPGMESILFLEALRATCASEEEYKTILSENATELQLYGVVDPVAIARESYEDEDGEEEEIATEAKNIVRLNKQARVSTEVARISIGLAKKANDPLYKQYHKYSVLKRQFREKIYAKYGSRATPLARKAVANGRNRAAMINSPAGAGIVSKIDSRLKQLDKAARNMTAIKRDVEPSKPSMGKAKK